MSKPYIEELKTFFDENYHEEMSTDDLFQMYNLICINKIDRVLFRYYHMKYKNKSEFDED
jgi:hypothetical protein